MFAFFAVGLACLMLNAFMPLVLCFGDVGGRYLLHCSWLCLTFMLPISFFFFLFFIYCNFVVFLYSVLPALSYFHIGLTVDYVQRV